MKRQLIRSEAVVRAARRWDEDKSVYGMLHGIPARRPKAKRKRA